MKRTCCKHWNYGYYGPVRECMLKMECSYKCQKFERRSPYKTRKRVPVENVSASKIKSLKNCTHKRIEVVDGHIIRMCDAMPESKAFDTLGRCKPSCEKRNVEL